MQTTSPEGTGELIPEVLLVIFKAVFLQEGHKFFLKTAPPVVFWLFGNIGDDRIQLRDAHAEGSILLLPGKEPLFWEGLMNPFGRTALDKLHRLGNRHGCGQRQQEMNMISDSANHQGSHFVLTRDATQKWPKPFLQ